ncbi:MAG: phosphopantothenoylcysteine decarboxylase, partial [Mycobacteriales bacterium]
ADTGAGRLPEPELLADLVWSTLAGSSARADLVGRHVVVSAGGTREPIDPVRFIGNRSSGKQGYALARAALARGAEVTLVAANTALADPAGVKVVHVVTAAELQTAMQAATATSDVAVMAAAVADFRPAHAAGHKLKKGVDAPDAIELTANPDILTALVSARRPEQLVVGFAAETHDVVGNGRDKLARKGTDVLVVNQVGESLGFETDDNAATILIAGGGQVEVPRGSKDVLAHRVWDVVVAELARARA